MNLIRREPIADWKAWSRSSCGISSLEEICNDGSNHAFYGRVIDGRYAIPYGTVGIPEIHKMFKSHGFPRRVM